MQHYDVAVIGAGFGGLATALSLTEAGAKAGLKVGLFETVGYPGGCAAAFERRGYRFEAGAEAGASGGWRIPSGTSSTNPASCPPSASQNWRNTPAAPPATLACCRWLAGP